MMSEQALLIVAIGASNAVQGLILADHIDSLLAQLHFILASGLFSGRVTDTPVWTLDEPGLPPRGRGVLDPAFHD